jgi:CO/xanthine dehydrogenase Mo-binding subunit
MIPAMLSRKLNQAVMMRITREEEQMIGGLRPAVHGRIKAGFAADGRILAIDMMTVGESAPYEAQGDAGSSGRIVSLCYQPRAMRMRATTVLTNTPPRRAQSQPGGFQGVMLMEPVVQKAARQLGIDQVAIRRLNAPVGRAEYGPPTGSGALQRATSSFLVECLDRGAELFDWPTRMARSGQRTGSTVRGSGVAVSAFSAGSVGFDGLFIITPEGRMIIKSGIGNLGTENVFDVHRVAAEMMGMPWDRVDIHWGDTSNNLPWTCVSGGSQTTHAMTRAAHAAATDAIAKAKEIAARTLGGNASAYRVADERVSDGSRSMSLAQVALAAIRLGGRYDGHELPDDINRVTVTSATALAGQGLMGVARDTYGRQGATLGFTAGFAEVEVDLETGAYKVLDYTAVGDAGTIIHPKAYGGQLLGRSVLGMGHALAQKTVYDQHYGLSLANRFYQNRPPTILDIPRNMQWDAVNLPDPDTPVGAKGTGEPPVAAGAMAILNALSAALGDEIYRRAPVTLDTVLMALEHGRPMQEPLTAHI